jgi:SAM-dependent methyltransferase
MVVRAREHAKRDGLADRVAFSRMDAETLGVPDRSFDRVVSLFALLHLPDPLGGLREMLRVLRPGGTLVLGVGSSAPVLAPRSWPHLASRVLDRVRVAAGRRLEAPGFLNSLVEKHCPPRDEPEESALASAGLNRTGRIPPLVRAAGFEGVSSQWEGHVGYLDSAEDFWNMQRVYSSFARKRLESPEGRDAVREEFFRRAEAVLGKGGRLAYPYGAVLVSGRRPR